MAHAPSPALQRQARVRQGRRPALRSAERRYAAPAMMDVADLRRVAGWALVGGLCVSAAVAIVALVTDAWTDLSWKVVGTSLGLSVFTCTAAAGAALRLREAAWRGRSGWRRWLVGRGARDARGCVVARGSRLDLADVRRRGSGGAVDVASSLMLRAEAGRLVRGRAAHGVIGDHARHRHVDRDAGRGRGARRRR